jgi:hypothetical protein
MNKKTYKYLIELIRHGGSIHKKAITNRNTIHVVCWNGYEIPVIYDKIKGCLVTALPRDYKIVK